MLRKKGYKNISWEFHLIIIFLFYFFLPEARCLTGSILDMVILRSSKTFELLKC